jgi:hypothetical protein
VRIQCAYEYQGQEELAQVLPKMVIKSMSDTALGRAMFLSSIQKKQGCYETNETIGATPWQNIG